MKMKIKGIKKAIGWARQLAPGQQFEIIFDTVDNEIVACSDRLTGNNQVIWHDLENRHLPFRMNHDDTIKSLTERINEDMSWRIYEQY